MPFNAIKISLREYLRNSAYTFLNLISITIVLVVCYLGVGFLLFEHSYDKFHANSDDIYRLVMNYRTQSYGVIMFPAGSEPDAQKQLKTINALNDLPEVQATCQYITSPSSQYLGYNGKRIPQDGLLYTNTPKDFVSVFDWCPVSGSLEDFAKTGNRTIITESVATKLVGSSFLTNSDIIGSQIQLGGKSYLISAIIKDVPANSHFTFQVAMSDDRLDYWGSRIYLRKNSSFEVQRVEKRINEAIAMINPKLAKDELYKGHYLQPISNIHFSSSVLYELKQPGNKRYISLIALFTCFIFAAGAFNYSNITLALYSKKHRSLGTKKVLGASRLDIGFQIWIDSLILSLVAIPAALLILVFVVPEFNALLNVDLEDNVFKGWSMFIFLVLLSLVISTFASISPILSLSGRSILRLFKGSIQSKSLSKIRLRNYLVVSQFIILITISSLAYVIFQQLDFVSSKALGYTTDNILYAYTSPANTEKFQQQLRSVPGVAHIGNGSDFGTEVYNSLTYKVSGHEEIFDNARQIYLDMAALQAYGIKTSLTTLPNSSFTLINRTAAEHIAKLRNTKPEDVVGTTILTEPEYINPETNSAGIPFEIAGIFEDINLFSLHEQIEPYFLTISQNVRMDGRTIVGLEKAMEGNFVTLIETEYNKLGEEFPLQLELLSDNVSKLYRQDEQFGKLISWLTFVAFFLSSIGLIGTTVFSLRSRVKEIGIRKVLGAGEIEIIKMMVAGYTTLVILSIMIAWPTAYTLTQSWLQGFAYRIEVDHEIFPIIGIVTLTFTIVLVAIVSGRAAHANPVESITNE
jgi:putative ABC transport system permease protein